jgi:hypothetical protein
LCFSSAYDFQGVLIDDSAAPVANITIGRPMFIRFNLDARRITSEKSITVRAIPANADPCLCVTHFVCDMLLFHDSDITTKSQIRELASFTQTWSGFLNKTNIYPYKHDM